MKEDVFCNHAVLLQVFVMAPPDRERVGEAGGGKCSGMATDSEEEGGSKGKGPF
jgi:hypothetical protein